MRDPTEPLDQCRELLALVRSNAPDSVHKNLDLFCSELDEVPRFDTRARYAPELLQRCDAAYARYLAVMQSAIIEDCSAVLAWLDAVDATDPPQN